MIKEELMLECKNKKGESVFCSWAEESLEVEWNHIYEEGDALVITARPGQFLELQLDEFVKPAVIFLKESPFIYKIPLNDEKLAYAEEAFSGEKHRMFIRYIDKPQGRRILSENSLDVRGETSAYPHCTATVETRGESVFAARNTIDGLTESNFHGEWPYTSWGEGEDADASIQIEFGRKVEIDEVRIYLRSDFPHDNYWKEVVLELEHSGDISVQLNKTGDMQRVFVKKQKSSWIKLKKLKKDEQDPSPFPALTQWQVLGRY